MGIEPTPSAWKAEVLPLNYTRNFLNFKLVEGVGFEPTKAEPSDLQSDPFDRSGTPPRAELDILIHYPDHVNIFSILRLSRQMETAHCFVHISFQQFWKRADSISNSKPNKLIFLKTRTVQYVRHHIISVRRASNTNA
jgi:hypothetical protein